MWIAEKSGSGCLYPGSLMVVYKYTVFNFPELSIKYPEAELYERVRKTPGNQGEMLLTF
ncbi:hypothetical protein MARHY2306 [Marinobacter nauticus ATCC 49840]|nr:hypothetical protein MARHY2306 [Marinobacter nauticus ATCC 49840]